MKTGIILGICVLMAIIGFTMVRIVRDSDPAPQAPDITLSASPVSA